MCDVIDIKLGSDDAEPPADPSLTFSIVTPRQVIVFVTASPEKRADLVHGLHCAVFRQRSARLPSLPPPAPEDTGAPPSVRSGAAVPLAPAAAGPLPPLHPALTPEDREKIEEFRREVYADPLWPQYKDVSQLVCALPAPPPRRQIPPPPCPSPPLVLPRGGGVFPGVGKDKGRGGVPRPCAKPPRRRRVGYRVARPVFSALGRGRASFE